MDVLARYYTDQTVSELLVSKFQQDNPGRVLDLGIGCGSLIDAAYKRWKDAEFYGVDIDRESLSKISPRLPFVNLIHGDGLLTGLPRKVKIKVGSIDVAVCNPPYLRMDITPQLKSLLKDVGLVKSSKLKRITSDIGFMAQNLHMLKNGGELGIILPDSIFTGHEFAYLREDILTHHKILAIIQLPDNIFSKTEARTHILLLEKNSTADSKIPLYRSNKYGQLDSVIRVFHNELLYRMDYSYYAWKKNQKLPDNFTTMGEVDVEIKRGLYSKKNLQQLGVPFFHTSSFPDSLSSRVKLKDSFVQNGVITQSGDILIARVGKRSIGRVTIVESGRQTISDCVYRLRSPKKYRKLIWQNLISRQGQEWLKAHAHGVCSQVISKRDLLTFPLHYVGTPEAFHNLAATFERTL